MAQPLDRISAVLRTHDVIVVILFLGFVMRLYLADANSYWFDELLSVVIYGTDQASGFAAIELLAERSSHPPLYQFILYYWIVLFGDSEVATRTLSNLYVAGATLCLYILVFRLYGRRMAIAAALIFSLMYMPTYYALETRSYAQTLFLVSLSSLLLYDFLRSLPEAPRWKALLRDPRLLALVAANVALLLTHYYNIFFLGAQGAFLLAYLLLKTRRDLFSTAIKAVAIGAAPLLLMLAIWGPVMVASYVKWEHTYRAHHAPAKGPVSIFLDMVIQRQLAYPALALGVIGVLLLFRLTRAARSIYRGDERPAAYFDFYFLATALMPCALAYLLFLIAGHERYSPRYFVFCTAPLAVLLVLSIEEAVHLLERLASRLGLNLTPYAMAGVTLAAALVVLPGGYRAATAAKQDVRGMADDIATLVRRQPESSYIIYEANHMPSLDYYFSRMKNGPRVHAIVTTRSERSREFVFETQSDEILKHDYLVVAFTHYQTKRIPRAVSRLKELYKLEHSFIKRGRGLMIFRTR